MERFLRAKKGKSLGLWSFLLFTAVMALPLSFSVYADDGGDDEDYSRPEILEDVSKMYACKFADPPSNPMAFSNKEWLWDSNNIEERFSQDVFNNVYPGPGNMPGITVPFDPYCESILFNFLVQENREDDILRRCESQARNMNNTIRGTNSYRGPSVSLPSFSSGVSRRGGSRTKNRHLEQSNKNLSNLIDAVKNHNRQRANSDKVGLTQTLMDYCRSMNARMDVNYPSPYGHGVGRCYTGGGTMIVKRQPSTLETLLNTGLAAFKLYMPLKAMDKANQRHEDNVRHGMDHLADMGIPFGIGAGGGGGIYGGGGGGIYGGGGFGGGYGCIGGGFGYGGCSNYGSGYGNGCMYGMGGCGGHYSGGGGGGLGIGLNLGIGGGGGISGGIGGIWGPNTGSSGYCPSGACYGNGGVIVGGSPWQNGGGMCGIPPYSPYGSGCGGGGSSGGFMPGGYNPFMRGPAGVGGGGGYWGNGQPGFNTGFGGGGNGFGMGNSFPGPFGTANGGNGWNYGGQWGSGGTFGAAPFWGSSGGSWGGMNGMYAFSNPGQQYEAYVQSEGNRAQTLQNHARKKEQELRDASWSYNQAYVGAQSVSNNYNANYGVTQPSGFSYGAPFQSQPVFGQPSRSFSLQGSANFGN